MVDIIEIVDMDLVNKLEIINKVDMMDLMRPSWPKLSSLCPDNFLLAPIGHNYTQFVLISHNWPDLT